MSSLLSILLLVGALFVAWQTATGKLPEVEAVVKDILGQLGLSGGLGQAAQRPAVTGGAPVATPSGGAISSAGTCTGTPLTRDTGNNREEWESKNVPWDAYEVTWCGTFSGDDLTFKLYGPSHTGSACCWCVLHVKEDGRMVPGGEGPHPSSNCEHPSGSNGKKGKAACYKAVIRPGPIQEGYALVGGKWELRASYKGPCGCSKKASVKTGNTLMVRNDGTANTKCASVKPLGAAANVAYARAVYAKDHYYYY